METIPYVAARYLLNSSSFMKAQEHISPAMISLDSSAAGSSAQIFSGHLIHTHNFGGVL
jgi:hypothetical protein